MCGIDILQNLEVEKSLETLGRFFLVFFGKVCEKLLVIHRNEENSSVV